MTPGSPILKRQIAIMVIFIAHIQLSKPDTSVQYLYGGPRLGNASFIDYYFRCTVKGSSLQVFVNGLSAGGFRSVDSGKVQTESYSNFRYFTALVSVDDILQGNYRYDSIIVVSVNAAVHVEVRCRTGLESVSANNGGGTFNENTHNPNATDDFGKLKIQQLFSGQVVQESNLMTHGFICGVQHDFQTWRIENNDDHFPFREGNEIGYTIPSPSGNPSTVYHLVFLYAREPFQIVTVMLLTGGNIDSNVTCAAGRYHAHIPIADLTQVHTTPMASVTTSLSKKLSSSTRAFQSYATSSTQLISSPLNEPQEDVPATLVAGVVTGVLVAFGIFVMIMVGILYYVNTKKNRVKSIMNDRYEVKPPLET